jgi:hypothetical protein
VAAFPDLLKKDRERRGFTIGQVAWRLGVKPQECRELEERQTIARLRYLGPNPQAVRVAADVRPSGEPTFQEILLALMIQPWMSWVWVRGATS